MLCRLVDVGSPKQIVQPADAKPSIAIAFDHEAMPALLVGAAMLLSPKSDDELALLGMLLLEPDSKRDLARLGIEIVHKQHPIVAPVISHHEHSGVAARYHREVSPADLGDFLAHADDAFSPVQERFRMTPLDRSVDVLETVGSPRNDR